MTFDQVVKHFGSQAKLARALHVKPPSDSEWKAKGITYLRQLHIEKITGGKLRASLDHAPKRKQYRAIR